MNETVLKNGYGFATYPSVRLKGDKKSKNKTTFGNLKELLFGDYIKVYKIGGRPVKKEVLDADGNVIEYIKVRARQCDGFVRAEQIEEKRILEINFVDIGQGDGCHVVTPNDEHFIIDAGESDNMYRFLKWRFNLKKGSIAPPPFTCVITHSDADHYKGFGKLFTRSNATKQQFKIDKVYHNGMVEVTGTGYDSLGKVVSLEGQDYITDLCDTQGAFEKRAKHKDAKTYIDILNMTNAPKQSLRVGKKTHLHKNGSLSIEILGPIPTKVDGKDALPVFKGNKGKTKNGHSVMLMLRIGKLKVFLGGDLNTESEDYILSHYTKTNVAALKKELAKKSTSAERRKEINAQLEAVITKARKIFQCEIAKSCHHGSSDFTTEFLRALNPIATVISSGDDEPHCHPRPDTLGSIGKHSRGERSLIFNTELSRSAKEYIDVKKILPGTTKERTVTVYGMINVRTDGERAIIAQKLERPAPRGDWDIQEIVWDNKAKEFVYIP
jgi:beta-lactamase superfamily II metal-dependent hydrolase